MCFPMGGKSWFILESKSSKIIVDEVNGNLRGSILERGSSSSSWIRFGIIVPIAGGGGSLLQ